MGRNHFDLDRYTNMEVVVDDAIAYVKACSFTYDLIIVDLFVDTLFPKGAEEEDFLVKLTELLEPGGLILFNRLMYSRLSVNKAKNFLVK